MTKPSSINPDIVGNIGDGLTNHHLILSNKYSRIKTPTQNNLEKFEIHFGFFLFQTYNMITFWKHWSTAASVNPNVGASNTAVVRARIWRDQLFHFLTRLSYLLKEIGKLRVVHDAVCVGDLREHISQFIHQLSSTKRGKGDFDRKHG